jgi:hypothetical protein
MFNQKSQPLGFLLSIFALLFLVTFLFAQAQDTLLLPYDPEMESLIDVDGDIDEDEYPESFYDEPTLVNIYWGCDDSLLYIGLKAPYCAWLSIGFGSTNREGSNLIIGIITEDSVGVDNYIGTKDGYKAIKQDRIIEWDIDEDEEENYAIMEFIYPMAFPAESGFAVNKLEHGKSYNFNLGMSTVVAPKGKQERRAFGTFMIEEKQMVEEKPASKESMPAKKEEKKTK